jgi:hypothetical protein
MSKDQDVQGRANAKFKKAESQARHSEGIAAENAAKARALDVNTARLKGLRLEKERAEREAAALQPPKPVKKARASAKPKAAAGDESPPKATAKRAKKSVSA